MKCLLNILDKCSNHHTNMWFDDENDLWQDACEEFVELNNKERKEFFDLYATQNNRWKILCVDMIARCCRYKVNNYKLDKTTIRFIKNTNFKELECENTTGFTEDDLYRNINTIIKYVD